MQVSRLQDRAVRAHQSHPACGNGLRAGWGAAAACAAVLAATVGQAESAYFLALPSGLQPVLQEIVIDEKPDGMFTYARFRFVAPSITHQGADQFETRLNDFQSICDSFALPYLQDNPVAFDRVVISLSDRETEFGVADPEATQFFEAFLVENGACIWEEF